MLADWAFACGTNRTTGFRIISSRRILRCQNSSSPSSASPPGFTPEELSFFFARAGGSGGAFTFGAPGFAEVAGLADPAVLGREAIRGASAFGEPVLLLDFGFWLSANSSSMMSSSLIGTAGPGVFRTGFGCAPPGETGRTRTFFGLEAAFAGPHFSQRPR